MKGQSSAARIKLSTAFRGGFFIKMSNKTDIPEEYQTGYADFLGCRIDLSGRPLIPRPETEFWTRRAITDLAALDAAKIRVLDIFSGSGCVGVAVAKNLPLLLVDFSDIEASAVEQARINCEINAIAPDRFRIFESDIFAGVPAGEYDAILANPPYIDLAKIGQVQKSVLDWEPHAALFAAGKGLALIEKFLKSAKNFLKPSGFIYMEFDPRQKRDIMEIIKKENYPAAKFFKDQFGKWRFAKIFRQKSRAIRN